MGRKIVLTGTVLTDTNAPKLATIDPIESAGSLYLVEPMHPAQQWAAGVPASGATVPNILAGALNTGDPTLVIEGGINNGIKGTVERSGKGGLHVIVSQANALVMGDGVKMMQPAALKAYLDANLGHSYYVSAWDRLTRINLGAPSQVEFTASYHTGPYPTGSGIVQGFAHKWEYPAASRQIVGEKVLGNVVGPRRGSAAVTGTMTTGANAPFGPTWGAGTLTHAGVTSLASKNTKFPSHVFYRFYVEDLTVSGRTYEEVDAIDHALYTREVLTPGGRYYGDTYTDPATIP